MPPLHLDEILKINSRILHSVFPPWPTRKEAMSAEFWRNLIHVDQNKIDQGVKF